MVTYPTTPVLVDNFIVEFNTKIALLLTWLNNPLGKIQDITENVNGKLKIKPAMHTANGEYITILPDDTYVNYSWFKFDPFEYNSSRKRAKILIGADFNIFLNIDNVLGEVKISRDLENIKINVINALNTIVLRSGAVRIRLISENYRDVYKGYIISDIDDKYFMQPYAGLHFRLDIFLKNNVCGISQWTADSIDIDASGVDFTADGALFT